MNDFYTAGTGNFNAFTTARAEDIVNEISSIEAGFDKLPAELALNQDRVTYLAAGGTANALTATLSPVPSAYVDGMTINLKIANNNTGAATLNVNALGAISIVDESGANIAADALTAGHVHRMVYVSGKFRLLNNSAKVAAAAASATAAAASAAAAATSEANAATSETNAAASASAASSSATSASGSASAAAASASAASSSATSASGSASSASSSASSASSSASAAAGSASAASSSETNAAASAASAAASYDSFDDRYLGAKASDPTLDNDGNALLEGAIYWNTTSKVFRAWDGSAWDGSLGPYLPLAGGTLTGQFVSDVGGASAPGISFTGSLATGIYSPAADELAFGTSSTQRQRIYSDGRVVVGTGALQSAWMSVYSGTYDTGAFFISSDRYSTIRFQDSTSTGTGGARVGCDGDDFYVMTGAAESERLRINAAGRVLIGKSVNDITVDGIEFAANAEVIFTRTSATPLYINRKGTDGTVIDIRNDNTTVGSVTFSGSTTAYNTSSDYRLKNVDGPLLNSGAFIDALKPVRGSWKVDGSTFIGFLAHEVQEVSETPIATGEKDGEEMQTMTYSSPEMMAHIIAELQSLRARVTELEAVV